MERATVQRQLERGGSRVRAIRTEGREFNGKNAATRGECTRILLHWRFGHVLGTGRKRRRPVRSTVAILN